MCGRYVRKLTAAELEEWFEAYIAQWHEAPVGYNIAPMTVQPVVRATADGRRAIHGLNWGLVPHWAKDHSMRSGMINARSEEAGLKPAFRESLAKRRCLIPATAFYEWQKRSGKRQPWAIGMADGEAMAFGGLWDCWYGADGRPFESFTILTTRANVLISPIHERMPVIVRRSDYAEWLDVDVPPRKDLLDPFPADEMRCWQVSERVGDVRNQDSTLLNEESPRQGSLFDLD